MKKREVTRPNAKTHLPRVSWEAEMSGELLRLRILVRS